MLCEKVWRERLSTQGYSYWAFEDRVVPRIPDEYFHCVIYLYHSVEDAKNRSVHSSGGSGFLVAVPSAYPGCMHLYAVSCRHVVEVSPVVRVNTADGNVDIIEYKNTDWIFTDDQDIAVLPIALSKQQHQVNALLVSSFLTKEIIQRERIGPGDDVFMVGRFVHHEGYKRNMPSARFGNLAMMPGEPVRHKRNNPPEQLSFLADIRTVGGYSGSPVFVLPRVIEVFPGNNVFIGLSHGHGAPPKMPWLLGVEWGHLLDHDDKNTGMSGVVPAWCLAELLNSPRVEESRRQEVVRFAALDTAGGTRPT
jgi:hypothetical protein